MLACQAVIITHENPRDGERVGATDGRGTFGQVREARLRRAIHVNARETPLLKERSETQGSPSSPKSSKSAVTDTLRHQAPADAWPMKGVWKQSRCQGRWMKKAMWRGRAVDRPEEAGACGVLRQAACGAARPRHAVPADGVAAVPPNGAGTAGHPGEEKGRETGSASQHLLSQPA
ncbi:hypothetical protein SKAU_G00106410 [Synaphobranchus kaupii]|uniref:Uncharacterized protein n=1 Tax=Synaphobranchus kaupii TaxID=118154 RepID=A0A9Q1FZD8_SYNKA|nr:hypothetical protein SKAU_G00106410 [Synaphobranchus kaupii]